MASVSSIGTLSSPGIGSGLDVNTIVSQLMTIERQPITDLQNQQTSYQSKLSAYGQVKSALATLQTAVEALSSPSKFKVYTASTSDSNVLSVTAGSGAAPGSYQVEVSQLAQQQKISSGVYAATTDVVGTGTLNIEFGSYDSNTGTFTQNSSKTPLSLTIDSSNNTLAGVRDAINNANAGVSASIINDGTGNRLVITSKDSGTVNTLRITTVDGDGNNTDASGLSALAYDPAATAGSGKNLTQLTAAQDALFTIDGIAITKPSNTVTDAVDGLTLNLAQTNVGQPVSMVIGQDTQTISDAVQAFVKAYNDANSTMRDLTAYDATNNQASVLTGDSTLRNIGTRLRSILTGSFGGNISTLSQIGVAFQQDGTLAVDTTKLQTALDGNFNDVVNMFSASASTTGGQDGIAKQLDQYLSDTLGSTGSIATRTDGINSTIKRLTDRQADLETRMTLIEQRYRNQFTALDTLLSSMNTTSTYLTQQLNAINNFNSNK